MSDKARRLYPLAVSIAPGEQPSAAKLTSLSTQAKATADKLEFMVGDIWNAAGDQILSPTGSITANALHIPNIARTIGRMAWLNAFIPGSPSLDSSMEYIEDVTNTCSGQISGYLLYAPAFPGVGTVILGGTVAPLVQGQFKTTPDLISVTGDWCVTSEGKIFTFDKMPSGLTFRYTPNINPIINSGNTNNSEPGWNVIPDPSTWGSAYDGVKISFANNTDATTGYHIWLPPRMPMGTSRTFNKSPNQFINTQTAPDSGALRFFQDGTSNASMTNGIHYRYNLPDEITSGAANSKLPTGYLYLWDEQFGTIIDGVSYFTPANTAHSKFKVRVVSADLVNVFGASVGSIITSDSTQIPGDYKSRFKIIVVGTSLAKAVSSLILFAANHTHKLSDGGSVINHSDLNRLVTPPGDGVATGPNTVAAPAFRKSHWTNDDHPQYFHRWGGQLDPAMARDPWDNAIFGYMKIVNATAVDSILLLSQSLTYTEILTYNSALMLEAQTAGVDNTNFPYMQIGAGPAFAGWIPLGDNTNPDTVLVRGGGTTGVAQIINGQFERMYFGLNSSYIKSAKYMELSGADVQFILPTGKVKTHTFEATNKFIAPTTISYQYASPIIGYVDVSPFSIIPQSNTANYGMSLVVNGLYNQDSTFPHYGFSAVKFPNGVHLGDFDMEGYFLLGGGSTGVTELILKYFTKPTASGFSPSPPTVLSSISIAASGTTGYVKATSTITAHDVDNSIYSYLIQVTLPHEYSSAQYGFFGGTIKYHLTYVNF